MNKRINMAHTAPEAMKAMLAFEQYLQSTQLTNTHKELIKIRASQINGCAYCMNMHTKDARKYGETEQRIYLLSAWRDTTFYTPEECAILALTEEMTEISKGGVSDKTYTEAAQVLGDAYLAQVMMAIIIINAWNRIGVTTHLAPVMDK